jgi:hypothetical protein
MGTDPDPLLIAIEAYLSETGISQTAFGYYSVNDPALVSDMRRGREPRRAVRERVLAFIDLPHRGTAREAARKNAA